MEQDGKCVHLEPKVMQVLLTLASEPGEVFTHEALQRSVWSNVVVGEDVLVRAIGKIRRAFEDGSVIETVPKVGYRLVAVVLRESPSEAEDRPAPEGASAVPNGSEAALPQLGGVRSPLHKHSSIFFAAVVLVLLIALTAFPLLYRNHAIQGPIYVSRPFTTDPGSQIQASFSPDGNSIAYVWRKGLKHNEQVYVMPVNSDQPVQLSPEVHSDQFTPVWSPSGSKIAFIRKDDSHSSVMVVSSSGGPAHMVYTLPVNSAREYGGLTWAADGKSLIFPQQNTLDGPSYLVQLSLQNGAIRSITAPPPLWDGDFFPVVSPNGRELAFIRGPELLMKDIYVMQLPDGPVRRITRGYSVSSLTWTADGSEIVFASSRNGTLSLWRVNAAGGKPRPLRAVGVDSFAPTIARRGHRLIYSHGSALWGIFAVSLNDKRTASTTILTSSEEVAAPRISPSGKRITFQSWRSGSREIWMEKVDGSDPVQITNNPGQFAGDPRWSPNGEFIAFDARVNSFAHIYVIGTHGGKPRAITHGSFNDVAPSWSVHGKFLFFGSNRSGSWQIWKVPVDGSRAPRQITSSGGLVALESGDGRSIYYTKYMTPGLWCQQLVGSRKSKIFDGPPAGYPEFWALSKDGIYALSTTGQMYEISHIDLRTKRARTLDLLKYSPTVGLTISPDGKELIYSGLISASNHLTLVENFRR